MRKSPRSQHLLRIATVALAVAVAVGVVSPVTASIAQAQPNAPIEPPGIELPEPTGPADTVPPKAKPVTCPPVCVEPGDPTPTALPTLTPLPTATPTLTLPPCWKKCPSGNPSSTGQPSKPPRDPHKPRDPGTTPPAGHTTPPRQEATPSTSTTPISAATDTARPSALPDAGTEWLGTAGVGLMLLGAGILLARSAQRRLH